MHRTAQQYEEAALGALEQANKCHTEPRSLFCLRKADLYAALAQASAIDDLVYYLTTKER